MLKDMLHTYTQKQYGQYYNFVIDKQILTGIRGFLKAFVLRNKSKNMFKTMRNCVWYIGTNKSYYKRISRINHLTREVK